MFKPYPVHYEQQQHKTGTRRSRILNIVPGRLTKKGLVNVFLLSLFQSSLLLIHFLYCPNTCSHYTSVAHQSTTQPFLVLSRHVTQRSCSSWGGAFRDDTINGCVANYCGTQPVLYVTFLFSRSAWVQLRTVTEITPKSIEQKPYPVRQVFAPAQERLSGIASAVA